MDAEGFLYEELTSTCRFCFADFYDFQKVTFLCSWDRTWSPPALDPCAATACQQIPFPPKETGLVHLADPDNPITLASEFTLYDVSLPLKMKFPLDFCGDQGRIMLVVGSIPSGSKDPLEIIFQGSGTKEAFHVLVDPGDNTTE